jgi:hypothetical protein
MGCGLHKLTSPARWNNTHSTIVDPPQDVIAFEDRVNLFWAVTNVDATGSSIARVPSSLAPDEVNVSLFFVGISILHEL